MGAGTLGVGRAKILGCFWDGTFRCFGSEIGVFRARAIGCLEGGALRCFGSGIFRRLGCHNYLCGAKNLGVFRAGILGCLRGVARGCLGAGTLGFSGEGALRGLGSRHLSGGPGALVLSKFGTLTALRLRPGALGPRPSGAQILQCLGRRESCCLLNWARTLGSLRVGHFGALGAEILRCNWALGAETYQRLSGWEPWCLQGSGPWVRCG